MKEKEIQGEGRLIKGGFASMTALRSSGRWAKLGVGLIALVLIGVAATSVPAYAASASDKPNLQGYNGPDAQFIINQLPEPKVKPGYKFKVGYLNSFAGINELVVIQQECEKKVKALGGEFIAYDAGLDMQKEINQMDQLISQKVDLIIAYPITDAGLTQGVALAKKAGIPVVLINTPASGAKPLDPNASAGIGMAFDQYDYATVKYVANKYPHGKLALIGFGPPGENLTHIMTSTTYWAKDMGLNVLGQVDAVDPSPNAATVATQAIMGKYPDAQIILAYNDYTAVAAGIALKAAGKTGVVVGSPNGGSQIATAGLKNGSVIAVHRDPWEKIGYNAAIAGYDILTKQSLPQKRMMFIGEVATKENVSSITFVH